METINVSYLATVNMIICHYRLTEARFASQVIIGHIYDDMWNSIFNIGLLHFVFVLINKRVYSIA